MNRNDEKIFGCLGIVAVTPILIDALIGGFVFSKLWAWIVAPTFGVQTITIAQAIGLSLVVGYFGRSKAESDSKEGFWYKMTEAILATFIKAGLLLGSGWIVAQFI